MLRSKSKGLPWEQSTPTYNLSVQVEEAHIRASMSTMQELADLASSEVASAADRSLFVQISHIDHGFFLNPRLQQIVIMPTLGDVVSLPMTPLVDDRPKRATAMLSVTECTDEQPLKLAVVINHSVGAQIEAILAGLLTLIGRQRLVASGRSAEDIDLQAEQHDTQAINLMKDLIRQKGWKAAAEDTGARARLSGFPLKVVYKKRLFNPSEIAARAPIMRRVYNEIPAARESVDKVVSMVTTGTVIVGGGTHQISAFGRDFMDLTAARTYHAHALRDAFVCGNGYLSYGSVPDEDTRLLTPEYVTARADKKFILTEGSSSIEFRNVLHITGADQLDGPYGVSVLEPFVQALLQRELMLRLLETGQAWSKASIPDEIKALALANVPMANRSLVAIDKQIEELSGAALRLKVDIPKDLYFPQMTQMSPAADGLTFAQNDTAGES